MHFVQTMAVRSSDVDAVKALLAEWHHAEAGVAPGYLGSRLLADRDEPGRYLLVVDFDSHAAAEKNNDRPETQEWAAKFNALLEGDAAFSNYDEVQRVG